MERHAYKGCSAIIEPMNTLQLAFNDAKSPEEARGTVYMALSLVESVYEKHLLHSTPDVAVPATLLMTIVHSGQLTPDVTTRLNELWYACLAVEVID